MSEYQYYEFHAIDKPLSEGEREAVSEMSSRVQLSPRKAIFTYSYSDFRYNEEEVLINYFDFMLYIANWGTKRIMIKFPFGLVDFDLLKKYRISVLSDYEQEIRVFKRGEYVVIDVNYSEEDGIGWIDEDEYGYDFINIRREIMQGDYRALFVIWLRFIEDLFKSKDFDFDYSIESKIIPPNLLHLSPSANAAKEFYGVNEDWLNVMRSYSYKEEDRAIDYKGRILDMSRDRMIAYLEMILRDEVNLNIRLIKELKNTSSTQKDRINQIKLLDIGEQVADITQGRQRAEEKRKNREMSEKMNNLRRNKEKVIREIRLSIEQGNRKSYVNAVSRIIEMKMMNDYFETASDFEELLNQIRSDYSRKSSFIRMLRDEKLIE